MNFEGIYNSTPEVLKRKYLDNIIKHNDQLKAGFLAFVGGTNNQAKPSYDAFVSTIKELHSAYKDHFETIDTESPDWDNYRPPHSGYVEEWEAYQLASEQEFQDIFERFLSEAMDQILAQRPVELLAMLTGLYEASLNADVPDELDSFVDVNEFLLTEHRQVTQAIAKKLRLAALSGNKTGDAFELLFRYCKEEHPTESHLVMQFEPILIALAEKADDAGQLLQAMEDAGIEQKYLPELTLLLYKSSGNMDRWLLTARQLYRNSEAVARELLHYYFDSNPTAFVETALELFPTNENAWATFLEPYVTPHLDEQLFVKVFLTLTISSRNIAYYHKLKPCLDDASYNKIIRELKWDKVFLVKILEADERYDDIKALVEREADLNNLNDLIAPILSVYPDFCFRKINAMIESTLKNGRGRSTYEIIAKWLILAQQIPGHINEATNLILKTYTYKPNLPALKDEMRRTGLVKV